MISTTTQSTLTNSVTAVFAQDERAEKAVKQLKDSGFDVKRLSIVGRDYHCEENVVGFYKTDYGMKYLGKMGAFWGGLWEMLFGSAFFLIPGMGLIVAAGPVVTWIIAAMEDAVVVGGVSALGAGLFSLGIPKDNLERYEAMIKDGKFLLIAHGTGNEVQHACSVLQDSGAEQIDMHQKAGEVLSPEQD